MNALYPAFAYLRCHWARSFVLTLVVALIMFVPIATQILLSTSERALVARGDATPLLLGSRGSQLDLTMAASEVQRQQSVYRLDGCRLFKQLSVCFWRFTALRANSDTVHLGSKKSLASIGADVHFGHQ